MTPAPPLSEKSDQRGNNVDEQVSARRSSGDERGEGVISTAIAVLIVALLGVALWAGFSQVMDDATTRTSEQIKSIDGSP